MQCDKVIRNKAFNFAKNPKYYIYQRGLHVYLYSHRNRNQSLKPTVTRRITKTNYQKVWDADLADMKLISKYNKGIAFLLCVIDIYHKDIHRLFL